MRVLLLQPNFSQSALPFVGRKESIFGQEFATDMCVAVFFFFVHEAKERIENIVMQDLIAEIFFMCASKIKASLCLTADQVHRRLFFHRLRAAE